MLSSLKYVSVVVRVVCMIVEWDYCCHHCRLAALCDAGSLHKAPASTVFSVCGCGEMWFDTELSTQEETQYMS